MIAFPGSLIERVKANPSYFQPVCHPTESRPLPYKNVEPYLDHMQSCCHFQTDAPH